MESLSSTLRPRSSEYAEYSEGRGSEYEYEDEYSSSEDDTFTVLVRSLSLRVYDIRVWHSASTSVVLLSQELLSNIQRSSLVLR